MSVRMKGFKLAISMVILGGFGVFLALFSYSIFYESAIYKLIWDWGSFFSLCFGLIVIGAVIGAAFMLYAFEKAMETLKPH